MGRKFKEEVEKSSKKKTPISKRDDTERYSTLTMLVDREWSKEISKQAGLRGMTKTAFIQDCLNKYLENDGNTTQEGMLNKKIEEMEKRLTVITQLCADILSKL